MYDPHDILRVRGARTNNLKALNVDLPKRSITAITGVSGSGKSSLVFDTIAAESRRLIDETYSTFLQGFMPSNARPDVDELSGLTAAIIVDQSPLGSHPRSTVGTATDVVPMLRTLFSRVAQPHAGPPAAYSFNVPSVSGGGAIKVGNRTKVVKDFQRTGGMCPECEGRGQVSEVDVSQLADPTLSLSQGALTVPGHKVGSWGWRLYAESGLLDPDKPVGDYTEKEQHTLFFHEQKRVTVNGISMNYEGLVPKLKSTTLAKERASMQKRVLEFVERAVVFVVCPECEGTRLAQHARESYILDKSIADLCRMEVRDVARWFASPEVRKLKGAGPLVEAIQTALSAFVDLGLDYLTLDRPASSLSGGEAQRAKMVKYVGSALTDVTYVFDEPSTGLHPADISRVGQLLNNLRAKSNTVLMVEHSPYGIAAAEHIIEIGPAAGPAGGEVVFEGTYSELLESDTATGRQLTERRGVKSDVRVPTGTVAIRSASTNNLQGIDVDIPTGVFTALTGVAGSGKSSLLTEFRSVLSPEEVLVDVDQSPLSASRRSNPATYTGALDPVRKAFAKANGVKPSLFSSNSEGACPTCSGAGVITVDLGFMEGADVTCEVCEGRRFSSEVLEYKLEGKSIADVMDLTAADAEAFFTDTAKTPAAQKVCARLVAVGLGYLTLGQPLSTLSGGERQRLKLAARLSEKPTVVLLDEPTAGLHLEDTQRILQLIDDLCESGATVIAVEHNLAAIAHADHVIDMGPGAGTAGGHVVFSGTPADLIGSDSVTGEYLKRYIDG